MDIKPLSDRVVVRPSEAEEKTESGIILPDTAQERPQKGEIIAVGPGKRSDSDEPIPLEVKKGDQVIYGKYSGTEFNFEGAEYLIMRESDILAVI